MLDILEFNGNLYSALSKKQKREETILNYKGPRVEPKKKEYKQIKHSIEEYKGLSEDEFYGVLKKTANSSSITESRDKNGERDAGNTKMDL